MLLYLFQYIPSPDDFIFNLPILNLDCSSLSKKSLYNLITLQILKGLELFELQCCHTL